LDREIRVGVLPEGPTGPDGEPLDGGYAQPAVAAVRFSGLRVVGRDSLERDSGRPWEFLGALMTPRGPIGREQAGSPAGHPDGVPGGCPFSSSGHPHRAPTPDRPPTKAGPAQQHPVGASRPAICPSPSTTAPASSGCCSATGMRSSPPRSTPSSPPRRPRCPLRRCGRRGRTPPTLATVTMGGNDLLAAYGDATAARQAIQTVTPNGQVILAGLRDLMGSQAPIVVATVYDPSDGSGDAGRAGPVGLAGGAGAAGRARLGGLIHEDAQVA
jgi:hypothetical protein